MPNEISRKTIHLKPRTPREYDIIKTQGGTIIKKRPTPVLFKEEKVSDVMINDITKAKPRINIVEAKKKFEHKESSIINSSSTFSELQKKVEELKKEEAEKRNKVESKPKEDDIVSVSIEDQKGLEELASGKVIEEQELINMDYLKTVPKGRLKRMYTICTGKKPVDNKYEMRKEILDVYKKETSGRKKLIYEASKEDI